MAWQRSFINSFTESFVQQSNRPAKLDQMLTHSHKLDKPHFHQMEDSVAVFLHRTLYETEKTVRKENTYMFFRLY